VHTVRPHTLGGGAGIGGGLGGGLGGMRELAGLMVTFTAVGTAIRQRADATVKAPKPTVDLST
jgi:hypothetical protein